MILDASVMAEGRFGTAAHRRVDVYPSFFWHKNTDRMTFIPLIGTIFMKLHDFFRQR